MKERVRFSIKRVQGTFEFEVQPLREYFCKISLQICSHSSTGMAKKWDKTDRFLQF
jgi:hypothetical protein